jgi:hypothetical protein
LLGFAYSNGFCWAQIHAHSTLCALNCIDKFWLPIFAHFQGALRTNTHTDKLWAPRTFGGVNNDERFLVLVHGNQQLNKCGEYIVCAMLKTA